MAEFDSSSGDIYLNYKGTARTALGHDSCSSTEFGEAVPFYQHLWFSLSRFPQQSVSRLDDRAHVQANSGYRASLCVGYAVRIRSYGFSS